MWLSFVFELALMFSCAAQKLDYDYEEFTLECIFEQLTDGYGCNAQNMVVESRNTQTFDIEGNHKSSRSNHDAIVFYTYNAPAKFLPKRLGFMFPNLKTFMATKSQIQLIEFRDFKNMRKLTRLYLPQNKIEKLPVCVFRYIENLEIIDVSGNKIEELNEDIFVNLHNLQEFVANDNQITTLDNGLFRNNQNLKEIYMQKNNISLIEINFMKLKGIETVDLRRNPCINLSFIQGEGLMLKEFQNQTAGRCNGSEAVC